MTYLAAAELVAIVVVAFLLYRAGEAHRRDIYDREEAWRGERADLLNRIQTGRPVFDTKDFTPPPPAREPDELHKIGTITRLPSGDDGGDVA